MQNTWLREMFALPAHKIQFTYNPSPEPEWEPGDIGWTLICVAVGGLTVFLLNLIFKN